MDTAPEAIRNPDDTDSTQNALTVAYAGVALVVKDAYRAGFSGLKVAFAYSVNQKLVESVPAEVVDKTFTIAPSPAEGSKAYARLVKMIGVASPTCAFSPAMAWSARHRPGVRSTSGGVRPSICSQRRMQGSPELGGPSSTNTTSPPQASISSAA